MGWKVYAIFFRFPQAQMDFLSALELLSRCSLPEKCKKSVFFNVAYIRIKLTLSSSFVLETQQHVFQSLSISLCRAVSMNCSFLPQNTWR